MSFNASEVVAKVKPFAPWLLGGLVLAFVARGRSSGSVAQGSGSPAISEPLYSGGGGGGVVSVEPSAAEQLGLARDSQALAFDLAEKSEKLRQEGAIFDQKLADTLEDNSLVRTLKQMEAEVKNQELVFSAENAAQLTAGKNELSLYKEKTLFDLSVQPFVLENQRVAGASGALTDLQGQLSTLLSQGRPKVGGRNSLTGKRKGQGEAEAYDKQVQRLQQQIASAQASAKPVLDPSKLLQGGSSWLSGGRSATAPRVL